MPEMIRFRRGTRFKKGGQTSGGWGFVFFCGGNEGWVKRGRGDGSPHPRGQELTPAVLRLARRWVPASARTREEGARTTGVVCGERATTRVAPTVGGWSGCGYWLDSGSGAGMTVRDVGGEWVPASARTRGGMGSCRREGQGRGVRRGWGGRERRSRRA